MAQAASYRLPDGSLVEITPESYVVADRWFGRFQFYGHGTEGGFQFGPAGTVEHLMSIRPASSFTDVRGLQSGMVKLAVGDGSSEFEEQLSISLWSGPHHDLYTPHLDPDRFVSWVDLFDLEDDSDGIVAVPREPERIRLENLDVQVDVSGVGTMEIRPISANSLSILPKWTGTVVSGGELFSAAFHDDDPGVYVLAGDSAISTIYPTDGRPLDDPQRLEALAQVSVSITTR